MRAMSKASRPVGARITTFSSGLSGKDSVKLSIPHGSLKALSNQRRHSGQHALEILERFPNHDAACLNAKLTDRRLVSASALLDDRDGLAHGSPRLEKPG